MGVTAVGTWKFNVPVGFGVHQVWKNSSLVLDGHGICKDIDSKSFYQKKALFISYFNDIVLTSVKMLFLL